MPEKPTIRELIFKEYSPVKILGQEIPVNGHSCTLLVVIILCATCLTWKFKQLQFSTDEKGNTHVELTTYLSKGNGEVTNIGTRSYEFTTPNTNTWPYILSNWSSYSTEEQKDLTNNRAWYDVSERQIQEFQKYLNDEIGRTNVQGYSRWEVIGRGTHGLKPGWTWRVTVPASSTIDISEILRFNRIYFNRDKNVYIEVQTASGKTRYSKNE